MDALPHAHVDHDAVAHFHPDTFTHFHATTDLHPCAGGRLDDR
jgi:hypothetical protein